MKQAEIFSRPKRTVIRRVDLEGMHMQHFACFGCRKSFKQRGSEYSGSERAFPCPHCRSQMAVMGKDFAPPTRAALGAWLTLEVLHSFDVVFHPGMFGGGFRPRSLAAVPSFLESQGIAKDLVLERVKSITTRRRIERGA